MGGDDGGGVAGRLRTVATDPKARQLGRERLALLQGPDGREDAPGGDVGERVLVARLESPPLDRPSERSERHRDEARQLGRAVLELDAETAMAPAERNG